MYVHPEIPILCPMKWTGKEYEITARNGIYYTMCLNRYCSSCWRNNKVWETEMNMRKAEKISRSIREKRHTDQVNKKYTKNPWI